MSVLVAPVALRPVHVAVAAILSLGLHLAAMAAIETQPAILIEGGGDTAPAALGASFQDFVQGAQAVSPSETDTSVQPVQPAHVTPPTLHPVERAILSSVAPQRPASSAALPEATQPAPTQPALSSDLASVSPEQALFPVAANPHSAAALAPAQPTRPETATPVAMAALAPAAPPQAVTSPVDTAPLTSPRPRARPAAPAPRQAAAQRPRETAAQAAPQPAAAGNSRQNAQRGTSAGTRGAAASDSPARATTTAQGNAAASSYPGEVLRKIQRVRQVRSPARGRVVVAFSIAPNGALASVNVARSSGHAALDRVALEHIQRAAPFSPPPQGAQRQFSFEFVGR